jgi:REP element-mobilizing transposase RayT
VTYKLRDEGPGFHHIVTRGNNKQPIYLGDWDRQCFLAVVDSVAQKYSWNVLAYCLMRNHYHLVLEVGGLGLARGMCELNTTYALFFNSEHGRINHLFGRRYWNEAAKTDEHLKNVIRYVLQNPRRAGASGPLESHPWTSYRASIGEAFTISRFARDRLLEHFGATPATAVVAFAEFCNEPVPPRDQWERQVRRQPPYRNRHIRVK